MRIHLIGAGGAGVSALGKLYINKGYIVSGSDKEVNPFMASLIQVGAKKLEYDDVLNVTPEVDLVVYSNAIPKNDPENKELAEAKRLGIATLSYPEALGEITKEYTTIAIAGTHGKTTTTAMVLHIMTSVGLSPTGIVGSLISSTGSNFIAGKDNLLVIEADEYCRAFLNYHPTVIGVTNIDHDHHDIYPTLNEVQDAFKKFGEKLPLIGTLVCSAIDQNSWNAYEDLTRTIIDYSSVDVTDLKLIVPGVFNKKNAQLAIAITTLLGVKEPDAKRALEDFKGTWRRQEYKGKTADNKLVYDDYAHHPTEVSASLSGFREMFPDKQITLVFQPHLYSRTKNLFDEFCQALATSAINQVIILPVYAAREAVDKKIDNKSLAESGNKLTDNKIIPAEDFDEAKELINPDSEVVITMGAGDVTLLSDELVKNNL